MAVGPESTCSDLPLCTVAIVLWLRFSFHVAVSWEGFQYLSAYLEFESYQLLDSLTPLFVYCILNFVLT